MLRSLFSRPRSKQSNDTSKNFTRVLPDDTLLEINNYLSFSEQVTTEAVNKKLQQMHSINLDFLSQKISLFNTKLDCFNHKIATQEKRLLPYHGQNLTQSTQAIGHPMGGSIVSYPSNDALDFISAFFVRRSINRKKTTIARCEASKETVCAKQEALLLAHPDLREKASKLSL
jgi:hypothetical protein